MHGPLSPENPAVRSLPSVLPLGLGMEVEGSGPGAQLCVGFADRKQLTPDRLCVLVPALPHNREQMESLELGDPRDTLEPKVMKEQEDSMDPQDPLVYR